MRRSMIFLFNGDDLVYVERFGPRHPATRKSDRVRREIINLLREQGKTKEEIEDIVRCFGL